MNVAVIVAHPDDETLWAGGTLLSHPLWQTCIVGLCRGKDEERKEKFIKALKLYNANGVLGDLDDGPEQNPIPENEIDDTILELLPDKHYDLVITHSIQGEYTRHLRHEEVGRAVIRLWSGGRITTNELWAFAYEDDHKAHYPLPRHLAPVQMILSTEIWLRKYNIITAIYGFSKNSFEEQTTPRTEAFWRFTNPPDIENQNKSENNEYKLLKKSDYSK